MSKIDNKRVVFVYAHWEGLKGPILMGTFSATHLRGKEIFSFEYNNDWLKSEYVQILDPDLQLYSGLQYLGEIWSILIESPFFIADKTHLEITPSTSINFCKENKKVMMSLYFNSLNKNIN